MENGGFDTQVFNDIKKEDISQPVSEREKLSFHQVSEISIQFILQRIFQFFYNLWTFMSGRVFRDANLIMEQFAFKVSSYEYFLKSLNCDVC